MLGLGDIMRDYKLSANDMTLMFDAVSESPLGKYTFIEVGITPASPSFVEMRISRFRQTISMMFEKMQSAGSHVYYVVVFRDNNKSRFLSRIRLRRRNRPITLSNTPLPHYPLLQSQRTVKPQSQWRLHLSKNKAYVRLKSSRLFKDSFWAICGNVINKGLL